MKYAMLATILLLAVTPVYAQSKMAPSPRIAVADIQRAEVIGSLGVPLGQCVQVQAVTVSGSKMMQKR